MKSASSKMKCPKASDEALVKNYSVMIFRKILQEKEKEKMFKERLGCYIKKAEEQIDMYRIGRRLKF